jgi:hypothetical protein
MFVVGVDGCRGGWLAVRLSRDGNSDCRIFPDMASLWAAHRQAALILVDIPIGLPEYVQTTAFVTKRPGKCWAPGGAAFFPCPAGPRCMPRIMTRP